MLHEKRFSHIVNLQQYEEINEPILVGPVSAKPVTETQMVLRMLVEASYSRGMQLPSELEWALPIIEQAKRFQREHVGIEHPFTYVTVRHGIVETVTDDEWHVDGFSVKYNHLPEANYVYSTGPYTTEFALQAFRFPPDFDPRRNNMHRFFQRRIDPAAVCQVEPETLYLMDPYVVHRRPLASRGTSRTFVRVSFTPIEIPDRNNTRNPLIATDHYVIDGIKEFRNLLTDYDLNN